MSWRMRTPSPLMRRQDRTCTRNSTGSLLGEPRLRGQKDKNIWSITPFRMGDPTLKVFIRNCVSEPFEKNVVGLNKRQMKKNFPQINPNPTFHGFFHGFSGVGITPQDLLCHI